MHRTLNATLKAYCHANQKNWDQVIPAFTFAINNSPSAAINNRAPHELVFGKLLPFPQDVMIPQSQWTEMDELYAQRVRVMAEQFAQIREAAEQRMMKEMRSQQPSKQKHVEYRVGDIVLLYNPTTPKGISSKLVPSWKGPYHVLRRTAAYNYDIGNHKGVKDNVHVRRLIKYDPFLFEHESVSDALERIKEDFVDQKGPIDAEPVFPEHNSENLRYRGENLHVEQKETHPRETAPQEDGKRKGKRGRPKVSNSSIPVSTKKRKTDSSVVPIQGEDTPNPQFCL